MKIDNEMYFRKDLIWWDEGDDNTNTLLPNIGHPFFSGANCNLKHKTKKWGSLFGVSAAKAEGLPDLRDNMKA